MFPAAFEYVAPGSLGEVFPILAREGEDAKLLAGGHSLLPLMKLRLVQPRLLVDIARIPGLSYIREEGGVIAIGATTTHYQVESSELLRRRCPVLSEAAGLIGDPAVRNRGTIGGSLAHADPGADLPAVLLALDARMVATSAGGRREIPAATFFTDLFATALQLGEVLTEIRVPALQAGTGSAYLKFPNPASRYAIAGVAAVLRVRAGSVTSAALGLTGAGGKATRLAAAEQVLRGADVGASSLAAAAAHAAEGWEPVQDLHASAEYRQHLARVLTRRALEAAVARAQG